MLIFGDIFLKFERDLCSLVTWPHCVSKRTSHSYNNLYPVKNKKIFSMKKNLTPSLCLSYCNFVSVIFGVILTNPKVFPLRQDQNYACSPKGSRIIVVLYWVWHFYACVKKRGDT